VRGTLVNVSSLCTAGSILPERTRIGILFRRSAHVLPFALPLSSRQRRQHCWLHAAVRHLPYLKRTSRPSTLPRARWHLCMRALFRGPRAYRSRTCCIPGGVQGPRVGHISVTNGRDSVLQPVRPSATRPFPRRSSSFYSRGSPVSLSVPLLLSARRWHQAPRGSVGCGAGGRGRVAGSVANYFT